MPGEVVRLTHGAGCWTLMALRARNPLVGRSLLLDSSEETSGLVPALFVSISRCGVDRNAKLWDIESVRGECKCFCAGFKAEN